MTVSQKPSPLLDVFDSLSAEREGEWLSNVYVQPDDFLSMSGMRSFVVFGGEGSGKTALRIALQQHASGQDGGVAPLGVRWHPMAIHEEPRQIVQVFTAQLLDACAQEFLYYSYKYPIILKNSKLWVQQATAWFIQTFFSGDWNFELEKMDSEYQTENTDGLKTILGSKPPSIMPPDSPFPKVLAQIASIAKGLGAKGVIAYLDGMETWVEQDRDALVETLKALLSTLALFEEPGFVIKMLVPSQLEGDLLSANSAIRRRWDIHNLDWSASQLTQILEKRAAARLGRSAYKIKDLFSPKDLLDWLGKYGGNSPRSWLKMAHPLLEHQQLKKEIAPLSQKEFTDICYKHPPKLRIDLGADKVFIGYGEITTLQPLAKKLLRYIYSQKNRVCTREDLFYKVHQGFDSIPKSDKDDHWVGRPQWEKSIDTALYRIRQIIEPDPKKPVYLISDTGKSIVRLNNAW